ncbi:hypothetical protein, partial [Halomonas sp.]|uniref:hypothetical protein n=1 Tax=Halomonas sp. TaxID=1486246 RepID=UPI0025BEDE43
PEAVPGKSSEGSGPGKAQPSEGAGSSQAKHSEEQVNSWQCSTEDPASGRQENEADLPVDQVMLIG